MFCDETGHAGGHILYCGWEHMQLAGGPSSSGDCASKKTAGTVYKD